MIDQENFEGFPGGLKLIDLENLSDKKYLNLRGEEVRLALSEDESALLVATNAPARLYILDPVEFRDKYIDECMAEELSDEKLGIAEIPPKEKIENDPELSAVARHSITGIEKVGEYVYVVTAASPSDTSGPRGTIQVVKISEDEKTDKKW